MVQALIEAWNSETKCFNQGWREVPFSYVNMDLLAGLPAIEKGVAFKTSEGTSEVDKVLKEATEEGVSQERQRRRIVYKDMHIYRNYVSILFELYRLLIQWRPLVCLENCTLCWL